LSITVICLNYNLQKRPQKQKKICKISSNYGQWRLSSNLDHWLTGKAKKKTRGGKDEERRSREQCLRRRKKMERRHSILGEGL
jgi:hypothetical protein